MRRVAVIAVVALVSLALFIVLRRPGAPVPPRRAPDTAWQETRFVPHDDEEYGIIHKTIPPWKLHKLTPRKELPPQPQVAGIIEGTVTDDGWRPISGVEVMIGWSDGTGRAYGKFVLTDARGNFKFENLRPETYSLSVYSSPAYEGRSETVEIYEGMMLPVRINFILAQRYTLHGLIVDENSDGVEGAVVGTRIWDINNKFGSQTVSDGKGRFTLADLPPVIETLVVFARGYRYEEIGGMVLREQEITMGPIGLTRGYVIEGVVVDGEGPVKDANVSAVAKLPWKQWPDEKGILPHLATTDEDGRFVLEGLETKKAVVSVRAEEHAFCETGEIELPLPVPLTISLHKSPAQTPTPPTVTPKPPIAVKAKIADISDKYVFIWAGQDHGVQVGDTFMIIRSGKVIAAVKVIKVIEDLCKAEIISSKTEIGKHDIAILR